MTAAAEFSATWDRHAQIGKIHVRMLSPRWPFRGVVEVWEDVWPALGGLVVRRKFRSEADAVGYFEEVVADLGS